MAVLSMTGFARCEGADETANWFWEIRSVNGRGLDVRLRLPNGADRLEAAAREAITQRVTRGNVSAHLSERRIGAATELVVNEAALSQVVDIATELRERLSLAAPTVEGLLSLRGVLDAVEVRDDPVAVAARQAQQLADLEVALAALVKARASEGRRLAEITTGQIDRIAELVETIEASPARTVAAVRERLNIQVRRLVDASEGRFDEARLHQEAVMLATKADIEEELQRLRAHVAGARELIADGGAVGRRFDFLVQEFNREANTVCSKSNDAGVTKLGLELKTVIEQMREQVQNIE